MLDAPKKMLRILSSIEAGDPRASDELLPLLYVELRKLARSLLAGRPPGSTIRPTSLVHEAYLRLALGAEGWNSRGHFFGAAAKTMRQILVDQARRKASVRHGAGVRRVDLDEADLAIEPPSDDILRLERALAKLERADPRKAQIVQLRYFAGLTNEEVALALGISLRTVEREWGFARTYLFTTMEELGPEH